MEATITDKKVHVSMKPSKGSEAVKEERSKKLSETVWSFPLPSVQFACAWHSPIKLSLCIRCRQTVFVSFLSLSGAESVLFLCSHKEKNQKKVRSAAGEKNPFHYASQRWADAIVASSFRRCHAMEDGFIFKTPRGGWRHSHSHSNPNTDIFYYHTNHLGSTAFVTDGNATVTQGFLYAPFGEITTEYAPMWQNGVLPNYAFNAKELDEESGMYYYEARYYAPPVFVSRDPMFEKYFWMSPYAYCANNPVKYVDPTGCEVEFKGFEVGIQVALKDLNKIAGNLNLEIKDGKLVIGKDGTAVTEYEKRLAETIKSTEFKSIIEIGDNNGYPGSYLGTELEEDLDGNKQYVSRNGVNISAMQNHEKDKKSSSGLGLLHEITEGYEMAKIAKEKGLEHIDGAWKVLEKSEIGAGGNTPQTIYKVIKKSEDYSLYESGHSLATPAPGE